MEKTGVMYGKPCGNHVLKVIDLARAYDAVAKDLRQHNGVHCYHFEDYVMDWNGGATHEDDLGN